MGLPSPLDDCLIFRLAGAFNYTRLYLLTEALKSAKYLKGAALTLSFQVV